MKKAALAVGVVVAYGLYVFHARHGHNDAQINTAITLVPSASPSPTPTVTPAPTTVATPVPTPVPTRAGQYKDGSYTGSVADAFYGKIQVKAVVSGGRLTNIVFLQYPNDRGNSANISQQSLPILKQEAIAAQSAHVNGVSGATDTSEAFVQSLSVALASAKA
jgi:uncharacterized protein with FMN-binding domain